MFRNNEPLRSVPHGVTEVELPEYHRLHGGEDAEGPPDFFRGETSKWGAVTDLDEFFQRVYQYYCDKGFWCIFIQWLCELASLGFTIGFSGFLVLFVNWPGLLNAKCGIDAIEEGKFHNCDLVKEALHEHPLTPFTLVKAFFVTYLALLSIYWLFCFLRFFTQLRDTLEVRHFIHNSLAVTENELQTMAWPTMVDKIVQLQQTERLCIVRQLSAHDIVSRIMRKENYLIGLLNKGVLGLDLPYWVPGAGPMLNHDKKRLVLTKMVEWSLNWCILQHMFDSNFLIHRDFTTNPARLRKRLVVLGVSMLLLSPFYVIFMFFYFLLRNAESFYHNPASMSSRRWSNLAKWNFREFNELEHMFKHRLNSSYKHAVEYVKQFPSPIISMIAKLVSYVAGAFAAVILLISLIDESLLEGHIGKHNLIWYTAFFAAILLVSRSLITEDYQVFDPVGVMRQITSHTHYMPKHWRGAENTDKVRIEFEGLFKYKAALFFEEIMSIIVTPFILIFALPKCVEDVLLFVEDFTVYIEGVGHVCSLSIFDFEHHGNSKYGSPFHTSKDRRSSQGKMEKSFISFKTNYPNWEPDGNGKQLMSVLADFRLRNEENELAMGQLFSSVRLPQPPNQLRPWGSPMPGNSLYTRSVNSTVRDRFANNIPFARPPANQASSDLLRNYDNPLAESSEQIYWLDKFYTASQSPQNLESGLLLDDRHSESRETVADGFGSGCGGMDTSLQSRADHTERFNRVGMNSTRGILGNQGFGQVAGESRWWARKGPGSSGALGESSFEPPTFARGRIAGSQDDLYESEEDHERDWSSQRHTMGTFGSSQISEDESPPLEFPFGDVYQKPWNEPASNAKGDPVNPENLPD
ncbi:autophagy-related protein 9 [Physcomitrium patens]|uniref:Autophagy-related protein 9 n=1 Tax=Physcomitrium patens TaxID=3218 RepID=A0A2K1JYE4_PHYPA|nr:autophagy-related protein 9-like [Physcomitrium patens]XP_024386903.1 autophagy-related protein 9-like [Physcomitrium patens]XP_024386904.1 autophagy-related protein 9-like [Physcomitrium patens]XP_024386905.1 autophagy-related protein 9-like [Physcomitrium patens]XP_024386907.1 autophagy-related protein 9-like [Physcomitrium patens]PNR46551.1 hypothetical protein PHYPA_013670 [Physcomitrium patens]|eukprot:XP_024386902.1 autophagy-related protein 9-like [Physcomitrella patens]